jgi:hypothetical protein
MVLGTRYICKCVQLPASAQREEKNIWEDGVVVERKVGVRRGGAIFIIEDGSALRGKAIALKSYLPLSIQPYVHH